LQLYLLQIVIELQLVDPALCVQWAHETYVSNWWFVKFKLLHHQSLVSDFAYTAVTVRLHFYDAERTVMPR